MSYTAEPTFRGAYAAYMRGEIEVEEFEAALDKLREVDPDSLYGPPPADYSVRQSVPDAMGARRDVGGVPLWVMQQDAELRASRRRLG